MSNELQINDLCLHIANGGGVPEWCEARKLGFANVMAWVNVSMERKEAYDEAIRQREQWYCQMILEELRRVGTVDIADAYDDNGALRPVSEMPTGVRHAIVAVETFEKFDGDGVKEGEIRRVKFSDKLKALELLGKNLQMFIDQSRLMIAGKFTLEDLVSQTVKEVSHGEVIQVGHGSEKSGAASGDKESVRGIGAQGADSVDSKIAAHGSD